MHILTVIRTFITGSPSGNQTVRGNMAVMFSHRSSETA